MLPLEWFWFVVVLKFAVGFLIVIFYNPHHEKRVVLDSGVTSCGNIGDLALLDDALTRFRGCSVRVLRADKLNVLSAILWCDAYVFVSGGLLKDCAGKRFMLRKLVAVFLARLFRKRVFVDSQTVFLHGFWRVLFKLVFSGLRFVVRDRYSFVDCSALGLDCCFMRDRMFRRSDFEKHDVIVVDSRFRYMDKPLRDLFYEAVSDLSCKVGLPVLVVPTMFSPVGWREVAYLFGSARYVVTCSFHGLVFGLNGGAVVYFVGGGFWCDYYLVKLSGV